LFFQGSPLPFRPIPFQAPWTLPCRA
jgi:hypothetical protein